MNAIAPAVNIRCAVYTRKSSEEGLEQSFNSLHAQREACEAYILSQRHEGWQLIPTEYDDGGFSGGTMERPALKRLLDDVAAKRVDTIVVYKVDRLTRSLTDFSRIVESFDKQGVSFVSVTQQFNTTTSMGRLTLNVLLSFAQFEREVTGERIRDKIAASKRKGMWMGGVVPLGYALQDRHLVLDPEDAELVRKIFALYLELGCVSKLQENLERNGIHSKRRVSKAGTVRGGAIFSRGALYGMLQSQIYLGMIPHKGNHYPGTHPAIIDQTTWDKVQAQFANNLQAPRKRPRSTERSILTGILFDPAGHRFIPSHANKKGKRYRYYVSQALDKPSANKGSGPGRIAATEIEELVLRRLTEFLQSPKSVLEALGDAYSTHSTLRQVMQALDAQKTELYGAARKLLAIAVTRITVAADQVDIGLSQCSVGKAILKTEIPRTPQLSEDDVLHLAVQASLVRCGGEMRFVLPSGDERGQPRTVPSLVRAVARAHDWVERILRGDALNQREIACESGLDERYVGRIIPLAFLAPDITEAILNGSQNSQLSLDSIPGNIPIDWLEQRRYLEATVT